MLAKYGTILVDELIASTEVPPSFRNDSGFELGRLCRAFVRYNGITGEIYESFNVSSVAKISVGRYQVNYETPFINESYFGLGTAENINEFKFGSIDIGQQTKNFSFIELKKDEDHSDSKNISYVVFA